ncbi:MAG: T9SS type A sorting domain-containing protein [Saprospiraceae bacterium]|nr:T9SS type A sorting domain-containing protein [Bacteroidia bacterium]MBT8230380.1 T9SS type A sorting domain-containing protein [Bacteroidia bacterium]NNF22500.1 T9SS type A sorting domain-containing protein [Saprospiraceae bacterium]NNK89494.1 T9SS type A sorting domain-containing protein [Saprospiraceae bacterium]
MKYILLFLFTLTTIITNGQISVLDQSVSVEILPDVEENKTNVRIQNTTSETIEFYWDIQRDDAPAEWEFKLCDINLCYVWGVEACPCSQTNYFAPGDTATIQLYINPNGVIGTADVTVRILESCGRDSIYASFPVSYNVSNSVSTEFEEIEDNTILYPNPSSNSFRLKNDSNVSNIIVYNIIGKRMYSEAHRPGMSHEISQLNRGIYLVRILDRSNNIIKVLRLNKE